MMILSVVVFDFSVHLFLFCCLELNQSNRKSQSNATFAIKANKPTFMTLIENFKINTVFEGFPLFSSSFPVP